MRSITRDHSARTGLLTRTNPSVCARPVLGRRGGRREDPPRRVHGGRTEGPVPEEPVAAGWAERLTGDERGPAPRHARGRSAIGGRGGSTRRGASSLKRRRDSSAGQGAAPAESPSVAGAGLAWQSSPPPVHRLAKLGAAEPVAEQGPGLPRLGPEGRAHQGMGKA